MVSSIEDIMKDNQISYIKNKLKENALKNLKKIIPDDTKKDIDDYIKNLYMIGVLGNNTNLKNNTSSLKNLFDNKILLDRILQDKGCKEIVSVVDPDNEAHGSNYMSQEYMDITQEILKYMIDKDVPKEDMMLQLIEANSLESTQRDFMLKIQDTRFGVNQTKEKIEKITSEIPAIKQDIEKITSDIKKIKEEIEGENKATKEVVSGATNEQINQGRGILDDPEDNIDPNNYMDDASKLTQSAVNNIGQTIFSGMMQTVKEVAKAVDKIIPEVTVSKQLEETLYANELGQKEVLKKNLEEKNNELIAKNNKIDFEIENLKSHLTNTSVGELLNNVASLTKTKLYEDNNQVFNKEIMSIEFKIQSLNTIAFLSAEADRENEVDNPDRVAKANITIETIEQRVEKISDDYSDIIDKFFKQNQNISSEIDSSTQPSDHNKNNTYHSNVYNHKQRLEVFETFREQIGLRFNQIKSLTTLKTLVETQNTTENSRHEISKTSTYDQNISDTTELDAFAEKFPSIEDKYIEPELYKYNLLNRILEIKNSTTKLGEKIVNYAGVFFNSYKSGKWMIDPDMMRTINTYLGLNNKEDFIYLLNFIKTTKDIKLFKDILPEKVNLDQLTEENFKKLLLSLSNQTRERAKKQKEEEELKKQEEELRRQKEKEAAQVIVTNNLKVIQSILNYTSAGDNASHNASAEVVKENNRRLMLMLLPEVCKEKIPGPRYWENKDQPQESDKEVLDEIYFNFMATLRELQDNQKLPEDENYLENIKQALSAYDATHTELENYTKLRKELQSTKERYTKTNEGWGYKFIWTKLKTQTTLQKKIDKINAFLDEDAITCLKFKEELSKANNDGTNAESFTKSMIDSLLDSELKEKRFFSKPTILKSLNDLKPRKSKQ